MPIHKRTIGAIGSLITGGPTAAIAKFFGPQAQTTLHQQPLTTQLTQRIDSREKCGVMGGDWRSLTRQCVMPGGATQQVVPQIPPQVPRPGPVGAIQRVLPGGFSGFVDADPGQAIMGQYGAGMAPTVIPTTRRDCTFGGQVRGMILGTDGLCYNKGQISNKERFWPRGRRPLLTGGEMRAISIAARAASRVQRTTAKLESIGMLKKKSSGGYLTRK